MAASEIMTVYPYRIAIPHEVWDRLFDQAIDRIDILVQAGQFLVERRDFVSTLAEKAAEGSTSGSHSMTPIATLLLSDPRRNISAPGS